MTVKITLATAVRLAEEIVSSVPDDFVYVNNNGEQAGVTLYGDAKHSCDYFTDEGEGSCIVGKVILAADVPFMQANYRTDSFAAYYLEALQERGVIEIEEKAIEFLNEIQYHQDRGVTWATSLERAKQLVAKDL